MLTSLLVLSRSYRARGRSLRERYPAQRMLRRQDSLACYGDTREPALLQ
jgi:hypothetical protein